MKPTQTEVKKEVTVKAIVTATLTAVHNSEEKRLELFNHIMKQCNGLNKQQRDAQILAYKSEVKANSSYTSNEKKAVNNVITVADNYLTHNLITARQHIAYSTLSEYVQLITKLKATKGEEVGYKKDKDSPVELVNKNSAIQTIITTVTAIYSNDTFKGVINKDNRVAYNDTVTETVQSFAKQYGKKIEEEATELSYLELYELAQIDFIGKATKQDLEKEIKYLQSILERKSQEESIAKQKEEEANAPEVALAS